MTGVGFDIVKNPAPAAVEKHDQFRRHKPPYWCPACDIGQSIPNCWLCAQPCRPIPPGRRALMDRAYTWPNMAGDPTPDTPGSIRAALEQYDRQPEQDAD